MGRELDVVIEVSSVLKYLLQPDEIEGWITTETGQHIPMGTGESKAEAVARWEKGKGGDGGSDEIGKEIGVRDKVIGKLKDADFKIDKQISKQGKSTGVYAVKLDSGHKAIWKETSGMRPAYLKDKMPDRQVAAYEADRLMGVNLNPPAVRRTFNGQDGVLFGYAGKVDVRSLKGKGGVLKSLSDEDIAKAGLFDYVINQRDRHIGNFRVTQVKGGKYKLRLIDNDLAFGHETDKLQAFTFLHESVKRKVNLPGSVKARIDKISKATWTERLGTYLPKEQIDESWQRLQNVKSMGLSKAILEKPVLNWKPRGTVK